MPIAVSVWRIDGAKAVSVSPSTIADESLLEDILEDEIGLLGLPDQVLVLGRQVVTDYSGRIDLLCVDQEGDLVVVEIKRDKTPREVVAQAMDYGYWCATSATTTSATSTPATDPGAISTMRSAVRSTSSRRRRSTVLISW
jgi:Endonuclease NucS